MVAAHRASSGSFHEPGEVGSCSFEHGMVAVPGTMDHVSGDICTSDLLATNVLLAVK